MVSFHQAADAFFCSLTTKGCLERIKDDIAVAWMIHCDNELYFVAPYAEEKFSIGEKRLFQGLTCHPDF